MAPAVLPVAAARRWLRHQRLLLGPSRSRARSTTSQRLLDEAHAGASGSSPTWSSTTPSTSTRGSSSPAEPRQPQGRLVRVERRRPAVARGPGRLRRRRAVQLGLRPAARPVLLAPLLLPPARPQLRQPRRGRRHARRGPVLARPRARRVPARRRALPVPAGRHGGENLPETHAFIRRVRAELDDELPGPGPVGRGQRVAGRRGRLLRRRRRVPPVLPLPAHAPAVHGRPPGAALSHHRDPRPDPRAPPAAASGPSSCATTTS